MKKLILGVVGVLVALAVQTVLLPRVLPIAWRPDVFTAVIVPMALCMGWMSAGFFGLAVGLISDALLGGFVGPEALACFLVALAAGAFRDKTYAKNWTFAAIAALVGRILKEIITVLVLELFRIKTDFFSVVFRALLPSALLTGVLCIPVYFICRRLTRGSLHSRSRYE